MGKDYGGTGYEYSSTIEESELLIPPYLSDCPERYSSTIEESEPITTPAGYLKGKVFIDHRGI